MLERASRSYSPVLMVRATLRWALTGPGGLLAFQIAFAGYTLGLCLVLVALMKAIFPDKTGLWLGRHLFEFGFRPENARLSPAHELLGLWFIPVCLVLGVLFTLGTTKLLHIFVARFRRLRLRLSASGHQLSAA